MRALRMIAALMLLSSCRHVPTKECRLSCEDEQDLCTRKGLGWWTCQERFEACIRDCPSK